MSRMLVVSNRLLVRRDQEGGELASPHEASEVASAQPEIGYTARAEVDRVAAAMSRASVLTLLLDYDGTLVPIAPTPDLAAPDAELKALLLQLASCSTCELHIVSGRSRDTLERWFGGMPVHLHAEHGFWSKSPDRSWRGRQALSGGWRQPALEILRHFAVITPGALVEQKHSGLAWHYRRCAPQLALSQVQALKKCLAEVLTDKPVQIFAGDKVIELRPHGVDKGLIAIEATAKARPGAVVAAFGDDATDEDMFRALPEDAFGFHVGPAPSCAPIRLRDFRDVRQILVRLRDPSRGP